MHVLSCLILLVRVKLDSSKILNLSIINEKNIINKKDFTKNNQLNYSIEINYY